MTAVVKQLNTYPYTDIHTPTQAHKHTRNVNSPELFFGLFRVRASVRIRVRVRLIQWQKRIWRPKNNSGELTDKYRWTCYSIFWKICPPQIGCRAQFGSASSNSASAQWREKNIGILKRLWTEVLSTYNNNNNNNNTESHAVVTSNNSFPSPTRITASTLVALIRTVERVCVCVGGGLKISQNVIVLWETILFFVFKLAQSLPALKFWCRSVRNFLSSLEHEQTDAKEQQKMYVLGCGRYQGVRPAVRPTQYAPAPANDALHKYFPGSESATYSM